MKRRYVRVLVMGGIALAAGVPAFSSLASSEPPETPDYSRAAHVAMPGDVAPEFELPDLDGETHKLSDYLHQGNHVVLLWYNPTCRYMVKHFDTFGSMQRIHDEFADKGFVWVAINSGSEESGTADIELNREMKSERGIEYPILMDTDGTVGTMYRIKSTPCFVVMDEEGVVKYHGAFDRESRLDLETKNPPIEQALKAIAVGESCEPSYVRAYGCAVKY